MLGRRQLREKVLQSLYIIELSGNENRVVEKNMYKAIDEIYDLYILLLNLLLAIHKIADNKIISGKKKNLPTEEDLNPNFKFVNNPIFEILKINHERNNYTENNQQLKWDILGGFANNLWKEINESNLYKKYMNSDDDRFNHHKEFVMELYEELVTGNKLEEWIEEIKLHWSSDLHIANTMVYNTIRSFTPKSNEHLKLFKTYKNIEDEEFASELFKQTVSHKKLTEKRIKTLATNWKLERIAKLDLIILQMALTEFMCFPSIPPKVTINEYIELAKHFSTAKSKIFVNGILDNHLKRLQAETKSQKN